MPAYSANDVQIIPAGGSAVFTATIAPCTRGLIQHSDGTSNFLLSGWTPSTGRNCCCRRNRSAEYLADVGANISIPTGGTVEQIAIAIAIDGSVIPYSEMDVTPAAVDEYQHVSNGILVPIFNGCCQTVTVQNMSTQPIQMKNLSIRFTRPDLLYSR